MKNVGLDAGNKVHSQYLDSLFQAPLGWFDQKSSGYILDRAITYQSRIDHEITGATNWVLCILLSFVICLGMVIRQGFLNFILVLIMLFISYQLNAMATLPLAKTSQFRYDEWEKRSSFLQ